MDEKRRTGIVYCKDTSCPFKTRFRYNQKNPGECCLDVDIAKKFYDEHGVTTCEFGLGQETLGLKSDERVTLIQNLRFRRGVKL